MIKIRTKTFNEEEELVFKIIDTTVGRVLFNEVVPEKAGFFNEVLTKKNLREIISQILKLTSVPAFLEEYLTTPSIFAKRVSSPPLETFSPG